MSRLFRNFGLSKNTRSRGYQAQRYDDANYYYQHEQQPPPSASSWRGVIPQRQPSAPGHWEEEFVEQPSMSMGLGAATNGYVPGRGRPTVAEYNHNPPSLSDTLTEETIDELDQNPTPPPIVQREASFSRIQEAFADRPEHHIHHSTPRRPVTDINLPTPTEVHGYSRTDIQSPDELHGTYVPSHPVMINNTGIASVRPEYGHIGEGTVIPGKHSGYHHHHESRHRSSSRRHEPKLRVYPEHYARSSSSSDSYSEDEYPPYVVVVIEGHNGKKDTHYVVPGGAPVIFQDDHGNEIGRVGDFSGRYRPRPPPRTPVIIQDKHGRELYRMGFDDSDSESDDLYYPSRHHRHGRDDSRSHRERDEYDGRSPHSSRRHRHHDYDDRYDYDDHYDYDDRHGDHRSHRSKSTTPPNVVYVDPLSGEHIPVYGDANDRSYESQRHTSPHRTSSRHHHSDRGRHYGSPSINLDMRHLSGAGSPSSRSYHTSPSHGSRR